MTLPHIVIGAGGHAKVLLGSLLITSVNVLGAVDIDPLLKGTTLLGIPVIGDDDTVRRYPPDTVLLVNGVGSTGDPRRRKDIFRKYKHMKYTFSQVIHPSAVISADSILSEGVQIMAGSIVQPCCFLGANAIVNTNTSIDHDCFIGDHVHLCPGVTLSGGVRVEQSAHVGPGATLIQGVHIGENSVVGAGSLVINDVPDYATVMGVPAKVVKQ